MSAGPRERAAPVITDAGTWGTPPPPFQPPPRGGATGRGWLALAFVAAVTLWLGTFALWQLTRDEVALATAGRALAALSEVDALLVAQEATICDHLLVGGGAGPIEVPGFVLPDVQVARTEVRCTDGRLDRARLRDALLAAGAEALTLRGTEAFRTPGRAPDPASLLTRAGAARLLLDALASPALEWVALLVWPLGVLALLLGGAVVATGRGFGRFTRLGLLLAAGAVPVLLAALALRFLAGTLGGTPEQPLLSELASITRSLAGLPLRDALWVGGGGLVLSASAWVAGRVGRGGYT